MKKFIAFILTVVISLACFALGGCKPSPEQAPPAGDEGGGGTTVVPPVTTSSNVLIAYFSCTNNTEGIAKHIEAETNGALYEIMPMVPYTEADLKYYTDCRADREQNDPAARPEISGKVDSMEKYGTVFLGYPIWHEQAPKIIYTFLESYDFSGKTIVPFCTSASSGIGSSDTNLRALAPSADWKAGRRFAAGTLRESVAEWIKGLDLKFESETPEQEEQDKEVNKMYITVNGNKAEITLVKNTTTDALVERLKKGDITYTADDYGGFEKVGSSLNLNLPTSDERITTKAGDVVLYSGNKIVIFYGSNTWEYTRLGRIEGTVAELKELLAVGKNGVTVILSLTKG